MWKKTNLLSSRSSKSSGIPPSSRDSRLVLNLRSRGRGAGRGIVISFSETDQIRLKDKKTLVVCNQWTSENIQPISRFLNPLGIG